MKKEEIKRSRMEGQEQLKQLISIELENARLAGAFAVPLGMYFLSCCFNTHVFDVPAITRFLFFFITGYLLFLMFFIRSYYLMKVYQHIKKLKN